MNINKFPGTDRIPAEIWKIADMARALYIIITKEWTIGNLPTEWNISSTIAIPKKKGFCTIALIQSAAKIYAKIINNRIKQQAKAFV